MIITIDGPTASGKSSVSRAVAARLGYYYIYSGLLYRALAYVLTNKFGYQEDQWAAPLERDVRAIFDPDRLVYRFVNQRESIVFDGQDITSYLKSALCDRGASIIGTNKMVREVINDYQRHLAKNHDVIVDGRDAGSAVFPNADIKIFLTATPEVRAERWRIAQQLRGNNYSFAQALEIIAERDERDTSRSVDPLVVPEDAIIIDSSDLTKEQAIKKIFDSTL